MQIIINIYISPPPSPFNVVYPITYKWVDWGGGEGVEICQNNKKLGRLSR
jgi:hypothetical protein